MRVSHAGMAAPSPQGYAPKRSLGGIGLVVAMHLLLAWALVTGLAQRVVDVVRSPIETRLIEERRVEPPPPPAVLPPPTTPPPAMPQVP
ncbi:MAG: energy transducer TonB, partial [Burkholderiales bacterium]|nr:energy transducer TonB [Burkholderiales bacterium]